MLSAVLIALLMLPASFAWAQKTASPTQKALPVPGQVKFTQKISAEAGGLSPNLLEIIDLFDSSAASLGDLDGDDVTDIAVGAAGDDDGGSAAGATYVLFLDRLGRSRYFQKSATRRVDSPASSKRATTSAHR